MRLWSSAPSAMCRQHLLGEHVETHMMVGSLRRGNRMEGFYERGLIDTRLIRLRHEALVIEMAQRGYHHASPLPEFVDPERGSLSGEGPQARCEQCRQKGLLNSREGSRAE
jgi:hypothetical protein